VEGSYAFDLLQDGAAGLGYLLKERVADVAEVIRALQEVARGGSVLDPKVVEELVAEKRRQADSPLSQLTEREREVLEQMAQGKNNASIARSLFLTERAIEKHINSLFHKLDLSEETDVHRRVMAVLSFLREAGIPPAETRG
jgi:DNA-binding NarL/FixJ family response regulator